MTKVLSRYTSNLIALINSFMSHFSIQIVHESRSFIGLSIYRGIRDLQDQMIEFLIPVSNGHELVRVGNSSDGGYLLPDDLLSLDSCLSIGCDSAWSFEKSLYELTGTSSHLLDKLSKKPEDLTETHKFHDGLLGRKNFGDTINMESFVKECGLSTSRDLILQMDIEGAEYDILLDIEDRLLSQFRIVVIEFHDFKRTRQPNFLKEVVLPILIKLDKSFHLVHFHPNNCRNLFRLGKSFLPEVFEVTYHRRDRSRTPSPSRSCLPHALDYRNVETNRDIVAKFKTFSKKRGK